MLIVYHFDDGEGSQKVLATKQSRESKRVLKWLSDSDHRRDAEVIELGLTIDKLRLDLSQGYICRVGGVQRWQVMGRGMLMPTLPRTWFLANMKV